MTDTVAWLIERADPYHPGCVLPNSFLGYRGNAPQMGGIAGDSGYRPSGYFAWVETASLAIRFVRRIDAEMFIIAFENFQEQHVHSLTLPGLRTGEWRAVPVEHSWTAQESQR